MPGEPGRLLFQPATVAGLRLANRVVMAPMTRGFAPDGIVTSANARYYARRARGGVGLIITEASLIDHPAAGDDRDIPRVYGDAAMAGWRGVVDAVHSEGSAIICQLWHQGISRPEIVGRRTGIPSVSPSGHTFAGVPSGRALTVDDIDDIVDAYARSAVNAQSAGFDGVELHGGHGYLIDQFLWRQTNARPDEYGGSLDNRTRFLRRIVDEIKHRTGPAFPVSLRLSQWKQADYTARLAADVQEWDELLTSITRSSVDLLHVSTRRYSDPAFPPAATPLAALTRRLSGLPVITVGSVGLSRAKEEVGWEQDAELVSATAQTTADIEARLERGEFDLVAVGRALLANPAWAEKVSADRLDELEPYTLAARAELR
jgi:2,4-dienoyl-CoA reductase-like NADH-dependent reductase (Old Yellow Enzyme family)